MTIYDPACGSGDMLTESQNFIKDEELRTAWFLFLDGIELSQYATSTLQNLID